jgi:hypothetical protein
MDSKQTLNQRLADKNGLTLPLSFGLLALLLSVTRSSPWYAAVSPHPYRAATTPLQPALPRRRYLQSTCRKVSPLSAGVAVAHSLDGSIASTSSDTCALHPCVNCAISRQHFISFFKESRAVIFRIFHLRVNASSSGSVLRSPTYRTCDGFRRGMPAYL